MWHGKMACRALIRGVAVSRWGGGGSGLSEVVDRVSSFEANAMTELCCWDGELLGR